MPRREIEPGGFERIVQHRFREKSEAVADLHDGQRTAEIGDRNAEQAGALELCERLHARLAVRRLQVREAACNLRLELGFLDALRFDARFEQFVQQYRVTRDLRGDVGAALAQSHEPARREQVLVQQRQVGAAPQDAIDHRQCPVQCQRGIVALHHQRQQARHETLQPFTCDRVDLQGGRVVLKSRQRCGEFGRLLLSRKRLRPFLRRSAAVPHRLEATLELATGIGVAVAKGNRLELARDIVAMVVEILRKRRPVRIRHRHAQPVAIRGIPRQVVHLLIAHRLDEILEAPQEHVGFAEAHDGVTIQSPAAFELRQHAQQRWLPQFLAIPAADQLHGLYDEFDFPNAARSELHIVREVATFHLCGNHRMHFPQ